jgi:hypothetical protein
VELAVWTSAMGWAFARGGRLEGKSSIDRTSGGWSKIREIISTRNRQVSNLNGAYNSVAYSSPVHTCRYNQTLFYIRLFSFPHVCSPSVNGITNLPRRMGKDKVAFLGPISSHSHQVQDLRFHSRSWVF